MVRTDSVAAHDGFEIERLHVESELAGHDTRHVEQIVDQLREEPRVALHHLERALALIGINLSLLQHARPGQEGRKRRAQLVRYHRQEIVLRLARGLGRRPRGFEVRPCRLLGGELLRFLDEALLVMTRQAIGPHQAENPWHERWEGDGGNQRHRRGEELDPAGQPVVRVPQRPDLEGMGGAAGHDEAPEGQDHPVERDVVAAAVDEVRERGGDGQIRDRDDGVAADVQGHERPLPEVAMPVGHVSLEASEPACIEHEESEDGR